MCLNNINLRRFAPQKLTGCYGFCEAPENAMMACFVKIPAALGAANRGIPPKVLWIFDGLLSIQLYWIRTGSLEMAGLVTKCTPVCLSFCNEFISTLHRPRIWSATVSENAKQTATCCKTAAMMTAHVAPVWPRLIILITMSCLRSGIWLLNRRW